MNKEKQTRNRITRIYRFKRHYREIILTLIKQYNAKCYFCAKLITEDDLPQRKIDNLTSHHIQYKPEEIKVICHRKCHKSHHLKLRRNKQKS